MGLSTRCTNCGHPRFYHSNLGPSGGALIVRYDGPCRKTTGRGRNRRACTCVNYVNDPLAKELKETFGKGVYDTL